MRSLVRSTVILSVILSSCVQQKQPEQNSMALHNTLQKLEYNNPGLTVDLDGGFKVFPLPIDFDGDGDYDLVLSESGAYAEAGVFYFENISGNVDMPVFRRGEKISYERRRLSKDGAYVEASVVEGRVHVITSDRVGEHLLIYKDVPENVFWDDNEIELTEKGFALLHYMKTTQWKMLDFDGDGVYDLVCAAKTAKGSNIVGTGATERAKEFASFPKHNRLVYMKNNGTNEDPRFGDPVEIKRTDGKSLASGLNINTLFADFDGDGDLDFIGIGRAQRGEKFDVTWDRNFMIYFENTGTKTKYRFGKGKVLTFEGKPIQNESRGTIHLTAFDWNKDGNVDLLAGDEDGKVAFIKNTGKMADGVPQFLPPKFFQQEAKYVDFGALTTPRVFDWDGDGLDDIISGNGVGHIGFFKNLGGYPPKWDEPRLLDVDGKTIRLIADKAQPNTEPPYWGYTTIDVGYWDEDDLPDIIANEHNGNIVWFKNVGTRTSPKLATPKPLYVNWKGKPQKPAWSPGVSEGNELLAPWRTSPFIMDFNNDGMNDLVILDYEGYLAVYPRIKKDGKLMLDHPQRAFVYPSGEPILLNQRTGKSCGRLKITFADWDGDGKKDLIVSSKPAVDWMKNLGMKDGKMVLQYMGRVSSRTLMGHTDGPVTCDFNKDGVPDMLVGTEIGVFFYWERPSFEITTTMTTTGKQKPASYKYFKR